MSAEHLEHLRKSLVQCEVPTALHSGLVCYIGARCRMGSFLTAIVENDLSAAVLAADPGSSLYLREIVLFVRNYAPADCWGSPEKVQAWLHDPEPAPEVFE